MRAPLRILIPALASLGLFACSSSDPITSQGLATSAVTSDKLADKSVTNPKLADGSVDSRTILKGAVTADGLAAGAVTPAALADNSVTSPAIADGSVGTADLAAKAVVTGSIDDKAVTTPKINDGAVTAAKLDPNAAVMKLNNLTGNVTIAGSSSVALTPTGNGFTMSVKDQVVNAATLQGNDAATFARRDPHVIKVATSGGDLASISDALTYAATGTPAIPGETWPGAPSATTPYVIQVGPGTYPQTVALQMKPYVDIVGSGLDATTIQGTGTNNPVSDGVVIWPANVHSRLENLTVLSKGGAYGVAVNVNDTNLGDTTQANLWKVRLMTTGAMQDGYGVYLYGTGAAFVGNQVEIDATGSGGTNTSAYLTVQAKLFCRECTFSAQGASPVTLWGGSGTIVHVADSVIDNPSNFSGTATVGCSGNINSGYQPLGSANGC